MISPNDVAKKTMTPAKKATAFNDFFAFYVGRPISYVASIPFIYLSIKPVIISFISMIFPILGFLFFAGGNSKKMFLIGWIMMFCWNILDGVDGNVARYTKQSSKMGSVYDAMSGYIAMVITFFGAGVGAYNQGDFYISTPFFSNVNLLIMGAFSGMFVIFPRLIMHKKLSTLKSISGVEKVKDKSSFGPIKIIALNISSVSGGAQVLLLIAILFNILNLYTVGYFIFNLLLMIVALKSILSE